MDDYFFIYRDATRHWCSATNPVFIAKHRECRAISKEKLLSKFESIGQFLSKVNEYPMKERTYVFVLYSELAEIY